MDKLEPYDSQIASVGIAAESSARGTISEGALLVGEWMGVCTSQWRQQSLQACCGQQSATVMHISLQNSGISLVLTCDVSGDAVKCAQFMLL